MTGRDQDPKNHARPSSWWSPREVPLDHTLEGRLGPLHLQLHHGHGEWKLAHAYAEEDEGSASADIAVRPGGLTDPACERILLARTDTRLTLKPVLADRPVVVRPRQAVILPGGEETVMYMSTPVSLRLEVGESPVLLREVPLMRQSDTWFGPTTREGELCYSGKTNARHELAEVPPRVHRALTPVRIHNRASSALPLEKISLPVPLLSLYGDAAGFLWTQGVALVRTSDTDMANLKIEDKPPAEAGKVALVSGPRELQGRGGLVRAFSVLFRE